MTADLPPDELDFLASYARKKLFALARELSRPVALGYLTQEQAENWLLAATLSRRHALKGLDLENIFHSLMRTMRLWANGHRSRQAVTRGKIERRLKPLVALQAPSNLLLAEAHDVNGAEGFPLTEANVSEAAFGTVMRAKQAAYWANKPRSMRHGR